jgi:poly-gamma-glutamate capsule biosynthesis protein CapA/YwtB (metallophosphatase superfamily)
MDDTAPPVSVVAVGDTILDEPGAAGFLAPTAPLMRAADVAIAQIETPYTDRGSVSVLDVAARAADPSQLAAFADAGFNVATLAGNHAFDQGHPGIRDTLDALWRSGIVTAGTGMNITEARRPALIERHGVRFGIVAYNTVGPRESWAGPEKPGAAYVRVLTHYELDLAVPGGPPKTYTFCDPDDLDALAAQLGELRSACDVVIACFHKGTIGAPSVPLFYERQVAHCAVDAGADIVFSHHAHMLGPIEIYRSKPIFHGLGNYVTATRLFGADGQGGDDHREFIERVQREYGVELDPSLPWYPFDHRSRNALIAKCTVQGGQIEAGFVPCYIDEHARPVPTGRTELGERVVDFVAGLNRAAGFAAPFRWRGDEIVLT